jgi:hypothetical protein
MYVCVGDSRGRQCLDEVPQPSLTELRVAPTAESVLTTRRRHQQPVRACVHACVRALMPIHNRA